MKVIFHSVVLSVVLLILTSCGASIISVNTANLEYTGNSSMNTTVAGPKILISEIIDERSAGDICNSYDTAGEIDCKWSSSKDVKLFIEEAITAELTSSGVDVISQEFMQSYLDIPVLKGKVRIFYGWLEEGSNYVSKVNVDFYIESKSYVIFYKSYLGENNMGICGASLVQSTRNAMRAAAMDIKEILGKEAEHVK